MATSLMEQIDTLTDEQLADWRANGYLIVRGFAEPADCRTLHDRAVELSRADAAGGDIGKAKVSREPRPHPDSKLPEELAGKIFWLHFWDPPVGAFITSRRLVSYLSQLIGPDVKLLRLTVHLQEPGRGWPALAPGHLVPPPRTQRPGSGLAGDHRRHATKRAAMGRARIPYRPDPQRGARQEAGARGGYVEITERDTSSEVPALLDAGDLLLFHSSIMHKSTDNTSDGPRVALVCHFSAPGVKEPPLDDPSVLANTWVSSIKGTCRSPSGPG